MGCEITIIEAIEILSEEVKHPYSPKKMVRPDALKLGIKALKAWEEFRGTGSLMDPMLLPGETKD